MTAACSAGLLRPPSLKDGKVPAKDKGKHEHAVALSPSKTESPAAVPYNTLPYLKAVYDAAQGKLEWGNKHIHDSWLLLVLIN